MKRVTDGGNPVQDQALPGERLTAAARELKAGRSTCTSGGRTATAQGLLVDEYDGIGPVREPQPPQ